MALPKGTQPLVPPVMNLMYMDEKPKWVRVHRPGDRIVWLISKVPLSKQLGKDRRQQPRFQINSLL